MVPGQSESLVRLGLDGRSMLPLLMTSSGKRELMVSTVPGGVSKAVSKIH